MRANVAGQLFYNCFQSPSFPGSDFSIYEVYEEPKSTSFVPFLSERGYTFRPCWSVDYILCALVKIRHLRLSFSGLR